MRWMSLLVLCGCLNPDLVPCGDTSCPPDTVCLPTSQRCVTQNALDACAAMADGAICTLDGTIGACVDGACAPAVCGDGVLEPGEACDVTFPASVDCGYFGYYRGDLSCTNVCQVDTSACSGRCGDGVIDVDQGEYCDHALPDGASCFDFGYDVGTLACGKSCGADLSTCHPLGWERVAGTHDSVSDVGGGDGRIGVVFATGVASVVVDNIATPAPGTGYSAIAGTATSRWAAGPASLATWTVASGWVAATPPGPAATTVHDIWASDSLGVFVSIAESAALWHFDGTSWTQITGAWGTNASFGASEDMLYVIYGADVASWDGTTWGALGLSSVQFVTTGGDGMLYAVRFGMFGEELDELIGGAWQATGWPYSSEVAGLASAPQGVYAGDQTETTGGVMYRFYSIGGAPYLGSWLEDAYHLASDGHGGVYTGTGIGLFGLERGIWDPATGAGIEIAFDGSGALTTTQSHYPSYSLDLFDNWDELGNECDHAEVIAATGMSYCATGGDLTITTPIDSTTVSPGSITAMWIAGDGESGATVGDHAFAWGTGESWQIATPPVSFTKVGGDSLADLYAIGIGDGDSVARLWHFDGVAWTAVTPVMSGSLSSLVVGTASVSAVMNRQLMTYDRATGSNAVTALDFGIDKLAGTGTELFAATADTTATSAIWFSAGAGWSPVRVPNAVEYRPIDALVDTGAQLVVAIFPGPHLPDTIYRLPRTGPWSP